MPTEHFRDEAAYKRNLAYRHVHGIPMTAERVCVGRGKDQHCHKVNHRDSSPAPKRIDARQRAKVRRRGRRGERRRDRR